MTYKLWASILLAVTIGLEMVNLFVYAADSSFRIDFWIFTVAASFMAVFALLLHLKGRKEMMAG